MLKMVATTSPLHTAKDACLEIYILNVIRIFITALKTVELNAIKCRIYPADKFPLPFGVNNIGQSAT